MKARSALSVPRSSEEAPRPLQRSSFDPSATTSSPYLIMRLPILFGTLVAARAQFVGLAEAEAYKGYAEIFRQGEGLMESFEVTERRLGPFADKCKMLGDPTLCPLRDMPLLESTVVESGGPTRCIFDTGSPDHIEYRSKFEFQVIPGAYKDKVILFLQGGGGFCYDKNSTQSLLCTSYIRYEIPQKGLLQTNDASNPYHNYTTVIVPHCSGDFFLGDITREYNANGVFGRSSVVQYGQKNLESVLSWIHAQQHSGALSSVLSELVIMGESGGSVAAQIWAPHILAAVSATRARVLCDSMLGVFKKSFSKALRDMNGCNLIMGDGLQEECKNGKLDYVDVLKTTLSSLGSAVPMLFSSAKRAVVQMSLLNMLHLSYGGSEEGTITVEEWYDRANILLKGLRSKNDATFWVKGHRHMFLATPYFERTSVFGTGTVRDLDTQMMSNWIAGLEDDGIACQQCSGNLEDATDVNNTNTLYCEVYLEDQCAKLS